MIQWLLVLAFSFLTLNANAQMKELPADIDVNKLTYQYAKGATFTCGAKLLRKVYYFYHCSGYAYKCSGHTYNNSSIQEESIDDNIVSSTVYFGLENTYRTRANYEERILRRYSGMTSSQNFELDSRLNLTFAERLLNQNHEEIRHVSAKLVSEGTLPRLSFVTETVENCEFDEWGNKVCEEPTIIFSDPKWIVQEGFEHSTGWINRETDYKIDKTSNYGSFMKCVEDKINTL